MILEEFKASIKLHMQHFHGPVSSCMSITYLLLHACCHATYRSIKNDSEQRIHLGSVNACCIAACVR